MVTKVRKSSAQAPAVEAVPAAAVEAVAPATDERSPSGHPLSSAIKDSAQQIWLAGLGAFSKAQEEGGKVFEALVKEGLTLQRKTQAVAEERLNEASTRVAKITSMATDISSKAAGQWDKLENIFEERVAKAMGKLGVPTAAEVEELIRRIDALTEQVARLGGVPAVAETAPVATETAPAKPARSRSRAKPKAVVEAPAEVAPEPVAEVTEAAEAEPAPAKPARRRTPRRATAAAE